MTKHTTRDKIWDAALTLADEKRAEAGENGSEWRMKFSHQDVRERVDGDPSERTVRDTMNTMLERGHLRDTWGRGKYLPAEIGTETVDD